MLHWLSGNIRFLKRSCIRLSASILPALLAADYDPVTTLLAELPDLGPVGGGNGTMSRRTSGGSISSFIAGDPAEGNYDEYLERQLRDMVKWFGGVGIVLLRNCCRLSLILCPLIQSSASSSLRLSIFCCTCAFVAVARARDYTVYIYLYIFFNLLRLLGVAIRFLVY